MKIVYDKNMQTHSILLISDNQILADLLAAQFSAHTEMNLVHIMSFNKAATKADDTPYKTADAILFDTANGTLLSPSFIGAHDICIGIIDSDEEEAYLASPDNMPFTDIIVRPVRFGVLLARLRLALRRREAKAGGDIVHKLGAYAFRPHAKTLEAEAGQKIKLTEKEVDILQFLLAAQSTYPDGVVSRATLLNEVWGYQEGISTHTLETHIYRLRLKIGAELLMTQAGGYRLNVLPIK